MGRVRIAITADLIREWLPLPFTASIVGSERSDRYGEVVITVEDPSLPEHNASGQRDVEPPFVAPTFRRNVPVEFVDWGLK